MKVRRASQSDFQNIAVIHVESWKDSYSNDLPAELLAGQIEWDLVKHWSEIELQNEDILLVAEEDLPVGFAAIWCRPIPFIDNLHVKPSHRSKGFGTALMKEAAKVLINKGHKTAYLWVFESNEKAIRFYERLGGVQKEQARKAVFGYKVLSRKIEWDNLAVICDGQ
jgi:ribosomal protein S18 acetylase RimI-like enzyme